MRRYILFILLLYPIILFLNITCATDTPQVQEEPLPEGPVQEVEEPEVAVEPTVQIDAPAEEPPEEPPEEPAEEPPPEPEQPVDTEEVEFEVAEDVFQKAFSDIELLIQELNGIVKSEDFERWKKYLTREYIQEMSSPETLEEISEQPMLKKYNIKLDDLRDYFTYVVVPSRSNARLDDLVFVDENHVKAIMVISGQRSILYKLENTGNSWKIGIF